jgi:hypothetical protein
MTKKNLEKFSKKNFFKNFLKVVQNHLKREKNSKKNFHFFPFTDLGPNGNRTRT